MIETNHLAPGDFLSISGTLKRMFECLPTDYPSAFYSFFIFP